MHILTRRKYPGWLNGKTSGGERGHQDHRTSSARSGEDQQPTGCGRSGPKSPGSPASMPHLHISGSMPPQIGDGLPDSIDLRGIPTTLHANADVHVGEALAAQKQDRLEDLVPQDLGLHKLDGAAIDLDQATSLLAVRDSDCRLLAAESLHGLRAW
eukprot:CAMPEP_0195566032 /NCGR_PEP_ID=MMETSP0814-20130614/820_1 /TAXON_ID=97485 /ORGANISM="Prymnesium parvum, Strain Texoma1" /LENGTH=155 /DNA_ID=CAMNT_0040701107 /DNA_START=200 /DNA_END=668 /DNA_ORIENTATION=+